MSKSYLSGHRLHVASSNTGTLRWISNEEDSDNAHTLRMLSLRNARTRRWTRSLSFRGHRDRILAFSFSPDGDYLATSSADKTVRLWRTRDASCMRTFTEHETSVVQVVISEDARLLVSYSKDDQVCVRRMCDILAWEGLLHD
ncbi:WD40-repeat-containing domain protein [Daedaleopsis nitida]|nr:WD40-repeat-containing domain protein [Daedaleopsis nitida]